MDIDSALKTYSDSFGGECPKELLYKLVKGDMVVEVDEEQQLFLVSDRCEHHDLSYPSKINFIDFFTA